MSLHPKVEPKISPQSFMRFIPVSMLLWAGLFVSNPVPAVAQATTDTTAKTALQPTAQTSDQTTGQTTNQTANQTAYSTAGSQAATDSRIVLQLQQRRVYLYRNDMLVSSYPVAIGAADTPTPQGEFAVSQMIVNPEWQSPWTGEVHQSGPDSALGLRWIEFATSAQGVFGFHGTPTIESIGKAASNGCVRMRNEDVVALFNQVGVGTTVIVQP